MSMERKRKMAKPIRMMVLANCPYCRQAFQMIEKLMELHPEYREVPLEVIDEQQHPEIADALDYYYVPTIFVDGQKRMEGVPSKEAVEQAFAEALGREEVLFS